MRIAVVLLVSLLFSTFMALADEKLPVLKVGSNVYSNVTVTSVTARDIYFIHDKGMGNAKLKNLEPALQKHFGYDVAKADAVEQTLKAAAASGTPDPADPKAVMEDAITRVKGIINQPVKALPRTPNMSVAFYPQGWFHPGASKPRFNTVDIRTSQELNYGKNDYVTSDLNPGVVFVGRELEFNSNTKYFYTDRSVPKKKLTDAEMLEVNRLYRIIGSCEMKLDQLQNPEPSSATSQQAAKATQAFLSAHKPAVIGGAVAFLVLLIAMRLFGKGKSEI